MKGEYPERVGQPECQVSMITDSSVLQNMSRRALLVEMFIWLTVLYMVTD